MKRINFYNGKEPKYLCNIEGVALAQDGGDAEKKITLSNQLANALVQSEAKDAIKAYEMALRINGAKFIDLDASDFDMVDQTVGRAKYSALLKAQLIMLVKSAVEAPKAKAPKK